MSRPRPEADKPDVRDNSLEQNNLLNLQNQILEDVLENTKTFQNLLDSLCLCAEKLVPDAIASVTMLDEAGYQLKILSAPSAPKSVIEDFSGLKPAIGSGSCSAALFTAEPTYVSNTFIDPVWGNVQDLARKYTLAACWSHPIHIDNKAVSGTFALSSFEKRAPTEFQKKVLQTCANLVSVIWRHKQQKEKLWTIAHHDALTGLPNRLLLDEQLDHALKNARRNGTMLALMFIDLDNFKDINDSYGHDFGDKVLQHSVQVLKDGLREDDSIYRYGGDEFLLVVENLKSRMDADNIARKILQNFSLPVEFDRHKVLIQFSIGVSLYPEDGDNLKTLLKHADIAMYQAKAKGRNRVYYFESELGRKVLQKITLEQQMREALERNEFEIYYQAQFQGDSPEIVSLEALIRWNHPQRGLLLPGAFIPVAETSSLMVDISRYVIKNVLLQGKKWLASGLSLPRLAVNFSTSQLKQQCYKNLKTMLQQIGFPAEKLEIEITETLLMNRGERGIKQLRKMSALGISVALDDFGTGFSSLSQLKVMPIDKIKIDRCFVQEIESDEDDRTIVKTIIAMAKNLGMKVVAEGVETIGQQAYLLQNGCDEIQGFYRHRPAPASDIEKMLPSRVG